MSCNCGRRTAPVSLLLSEKQASRHQSYTLDRKEFRLSSPLGCAISVRGCIPSVIRTAVVAAEPHAASRHVATKYWTLAYWGVVFAATGKMKWSVRTADVHLDHLAEANRNSL